MELVESPRLLRLSHDRPDDPDASAERSAWPRHSQAIRHESDVASGLAGSPGQPSELAAFVTARAHAAIRAELDNLRGEGRSMFVDRGNRVEELGPDEY
jgi:hypothetical protein